MICSILRVLLRSIIFKSVLGKRKYFMEVDMHWEKMSIFFVSLLISVTLILGGCSSDTSPTTNSSIPTTEPQQPVTTSTTPTTSASPQTKYEFKFTYQFPPGSSQEQVVQLLGKIINEKTDGMVTFKYFGSESLGKAADFITMLNGGVADAALLSAGAYPAQFDMELGPEIPGMGVPSRNVRVDLTWELFNKGYCPGLAAFKPLAMFAGPNLTLFMKEEVRTVEDLKGLKIRTTTAPITTFLENLGATPVAMTFAEQYSSLERGVIDGTITAYESFIPAKTYEVCKYALLDPLGSPCLFIVMSKAAWNKIPADLQVKVDDAIQAFIPQFKDMLNKPDSIWPDTLSQNGVAVYGLSSEESAKLKQAAAPIKAEWISSHQAKGMPAKEMMDFVDNYLSNLK
jgi:TRAP-type C4-dicarboxylate transport system substrate-binding protein